MISATYWLSSIITDSSVKIEGEILEANFVELLEKVLETDIPLKTMKLKSTAWESHSLIYGLAGLL